MKRYSITFPALVTALTLGSFPLAYYSVTHAQTAQNYTATWVDNSSNEKGFRVYKMGGPVSAWRVMCTTPPNTKTCTWTEPDTSSGMYVVSAFNDAGDSFPAGPSGLGTPNSAATLFVTPVPAPSALEAPRAPSTPRLGQGFDGPMPE